MKFLSPQRAGESRVFDTYWQPSDRIEVQCMCWVTGFVVSTPEQRERAKTNWFVDKPTCNVPWKMTTDPAICFKLDSAPPRTESFPLRWEQSTRSWHLEFLLNLAFVYGDGDSLPRSPWGYGLFNVWVSVHLFSHHILGDGGWARLEFSGPDTRDVEKTSEFWMPGVERWSLKKMKRLLSDTRL